MIKLGHRSLLGRLRETMCDHITWAFNMKVQAVLDIRACCPKLKDTIRDFSDPHLACCRLQAKLLRFSNYSDQFLLFHRLQIVQEFLEFIMSIWTRVKLELMISH